MDTCERDASSTNRAPGSRDPRDVRYEARRRRERSDFRWLVAHCVLLTLAISGVLVKLTQELN